MSTDALLRRQLVLTWVAGLVASVAMAAVGVIAFMRPDESKSTVITAAVVGSVAVAVILVVLIRHVGTLATFAFRKEPV